MAGATRNIMVRAGADFSAITKQSQKAAQSMKNMSTSIASSAGLIKKALGARRKQILGQFLTEAAVLSLLGGLLGIIVGIILARVISYVMQIPVAISVPAIVIAIVFSTLVGVIFGLLPSVRASKLNPIDALRYE